MATAELRSVDPSVWRIVAGTSVTVPAVNSHVYYFPQGHSEQSTQPLSLSINLSPMVHCRVIAVDYLANPDTDEVFAKIRLVPCPRGHVAPNNDVAPAEGIAFFAKVLTPSDANNGGGFSVPRFCADSIFPPLDFKADPPVQNITIRDIHGAAWEFRHIYRGTPRRHLLTTGWTKFVNGKLLVAGDSVVFMRKVGSGELFVGIRRGLRYNPEGSGRVTPESVVEAAELVARGMEFEVVCYPRVGWTNFVVGAEVVEESMNTLWMVGMRVKMSMETEDPSRVTWCQGTVTVAEMTDTGPWKRSPWKMLEVAWDEPEHLQRMKRVSPWQVEQVMAMSLPHPELHLMNTSRIIQNYGLQSDAMQDLSFPILGSSNSLLSHHSLPAGMQGARQSQNFISSLPNFVYDNTNRTCVPNTFENMSPIVQKSPQSEILSPESQSSVYLFGTEIVGKKGLKKAGSSSFQLFGKMIHVEDSAESNSDDVEGNGGATRVEEAESVKTSLDLSFSVPCRDLLAGVEAQNEKAPAVDTSPL